MWNKQATIALTKLVINQNNPRLAHDTDKVMAHSIASVGLLYPLTVKRIADGKFEVIDGARRFKAIEYAVKEKLIDWTEVPATIRMDGGLESLEVGIHANLHEKMHPLDEAEAIVKLSKMGRDKKAIALAFGRDERWADQRVALATLAPEVKKLFRDHKIGLDIAQAFTVGSHAQQKAVVKAEAYWNPAQVTKLLTAKMIDAAWAIFPLEEWPGEKMERSLFEDQIWLTDIPLFLKKQGEAFAGLKTKYETAGYSATIIVAPDDWQTINAYVAVKGKMTDKDRAKLSVLIQLTTQGQVKVWENMVKRKDAGRVEQKINGPDVTAITEVKALKAKDLSGPQIAYVKQQAALALHRDVTRGTAGEVTMQYLVVASLLPGAAEEWVVDGRSYEGWARIVEDTPDVADGYDPKAPEVKKLSFEAFRKLTPGERLKLYRQAVAALIAVSYGDNLKAYAGTLPVRGWLKPGAGFFRKYRSDQLVDYLKKSGVQIGDGLKKTELVERAVKAAATPKGYRLGLESLLG